MQQAWKIMTFILSACVIWLSLYLSNIPVAAKTYEQNYLTLSANRILPPKEYLYLHAGDDAKILDRIITCESGWNPNAKNKTSSASGLGQFINSTWLSTRKQMGRDTDLDLRFNPYEMIDTTIFLWDNGRGASHWECYHILYD